MGVRVADIKSHQAHTQLSLLSWLACKVDTESQLVRRGRIGAQGHALSCDHAPIYDLEGQTFCLPGEARARASRTPSSKSFEWLARELASTLGRRLTSESTLAS